MNIILFDDDTSNRLLPLTFTKPVSEIRIGILTIKEKWEVLSESTVSYLTHEYLSHKFKAVLSTTEDNFYINSKIVPDIDFFNESYRYLLFLRDYKFKHKNIEGVVKDFLKGKDRETATKISMEILGYNISVL